jgi:exodeoxyribonuclease VII small subunit
MGRRGKVDEIEYAFALSPNGLPPMARAPKNAASTDAPASDAALVVALPERYEDALAELEDLVARMESGSLPLDQLLVHYQRGAQLLQLCRSRLDAIEQQVKVLEDGQLKVWDAE